MSDSALNDVIRENAMLASYRTTAWSGKVPDPNAAAVAAKALGVPEEAYRMVKNLMVDNDARLDAVHKAQEAGRREHLRLTLPWTSDDADKGPRLIPNDRWIDYMKVMGPAKSRYDAALTEFLANYADDAAKAQVSLKMPGDPLRLYPDPAQVADRFTLQLRFDPIAAGAQFRGLPDGYDEKLQENYEGRLRDSMKSAMSEAYLRAHKAVKNLGERLSAEKLTFKEAAVDNVRELAPMLEAWNLYKDENMSVLAADIQKLVAGEDMKSLKANDTVRHLVAKEARRIVAMIEEWEVLPS